MCLDKFPELAVVGFFILGGKTARGQLIHLEMIGKAVAAFAMMGAAGVGTGAVDGIGTVAHEKLLFLAKLGHCSGNKRIL